MSWWKRFEWVEPDFPKVGEPLERHDGLWQYHVVDTVSTGRFGDTGYYTDKDALEESANLVVEIRKNKKLVSKI